MPDPQPETWALIGVIIAQLVALIIFVLQNRHNSRLQRERTQLDRIDRISSQRLSDFYGPLRAVLLRARYAFHSFMVLAQKGNNSKASMILEQHLMPLNRAAVDLISNKFHLLDPRDEDGPYDQFIRHVDSLELLEITGDNDIDKVEFPEGLYENVDRFYTMLAKELAISLMVPER